MLPLHKLQGESSSSPQAREEEGKQELKSKMWTLDGRILYTNYGGLFSRFSQEKSSASQTQTGVGGGGQGATFRR